MQNNPPVHNYVPRAASSYWNYSLRNVIPCSIAGPSKCQTTQRHPDKYDDYVRDHLRENLLSSWQDCLDSDHRVASHNDLLNIPTPIDGGLYYNKHFLPAASHCTQRDLVKSPDGRKRYPQQYFGRYLGLMPKYTDDFPRVTSSSVNP